MRIATMKISLIALAMIWSTTVAAAQNADADDQMHELSRELDELNEQLHRRHVELEELQRILQQIESHKSGLEARQERLAEMIDRDRGHDRRRQQEHGEIDLREMMGKFAGMGGVGEIIIERRSADRDNSHVDRQVIPFDLDELDSEGLERIQIMMDQHIRGEGGSEVQISVEIMTDDEHDEYDEDDDRWESRRVEIDRRDDAHRRNEGHGEGHGGMPDDRDMDPDIREHIMEMMRQGFHMPEGMNPLDAHRRNEGHGEGHGGMFDDHDMDPDIREHIMEMMRQGFHMPEGMNPHDAHRRNEGMNPHDAHRRNEGHGEGHGGMPGDVGRWIARLHEEQAHGAMLPQHAIAEVPMESWGQRQMSRPPQEPGDEMLERLDRMDALAERLQRGDRMALLGISLTQDLLGPEERINTLKHFLGNDSYTLVARNAAAMVIINALVELGETEQAQSLLMRLISANAAKEYPPKATETPQPDPAGDGG
jgi:hypothetical protein